MIGNAVSTLQPIPTPVKPEHFDYVTVARNNGIDARDLAAIVRLFEQDYPRDLMLRELHILRVCNAIAAGRVQLAEVLRQAPPATAA